MTSPPKGREGSWWRAGFQLIRRSCARFNLKVDARCLMACRRCRCEVSPLCDTDPPGARQTL